MTAAVSPNFALQFFLFLCVTLLINLQGHANDLGMERKGRLDDYKPINSKIVMWHTQDAEQAKFLKLLMQDFSAAHPHSPVLVEDIIEFGVSLHKAAQFGALPDVIFAPSDTVSLQKELQLSLVPRAVQNAQVPEKALRTVSLDFKLYGAPVFGGNHLVVYWNSQKLKLAPQTTQDLRWPLTDGYFFLPFLLQTKGFSPQKSELNEKESITALTEYRKIILNFLQYESADCAYNCLVKKFYQEQIPAIINGEWAFEDAFQILGSKLKIAPLPFFYGQRLRSPGGTFSLMFPKKSLSGEKEIVLKELIHYMQSTEVQNRIFMQAKRIPVHAGVLASNRQKLEREGMNEKAKLYEEILKLNQQSFTFQPSPALPYFWTGLNKGLRFLQLKTCSVEKAFEIINSTMAFSEYKVTNNSEDVLISNP
jgi:maltose-binding protein MalE